jgi:putative ribosome biogenesis GTPase RsgA
VLVSGEAGIGKTSLVNHFTQAQHCADAMGCVRFAVHTAPARPFA